MVDPAARLQAADRRSAFTHAPMGFALATPEGVLVDANPALAMLLGSTPEELLGQSVLDLTHADARALAHEAHAGLLRTPAHTMRLETRLVHSDGTDIPVQVTASCVLAVPEGPPSHLVIIVENITDRKALEAALTHQSLHDPLTGLPNRSLFRDRLRHALERGHRERTPTCLLGIDLDDFKAINDRLGHPVGDLVLVRFADQLRSVLRASDTAARLGGDEFAIVCENTAATDAAVLADRLRTVAARPLALVGGLVTVGVSIGVGCTDGAEAAVEVYTRIIREADDAMYADKAARRR